MRLQMQRGVFHSLLTKGHHASVNCDWVTGGGGAGRRKGGEVAWCNFQKHVELSNFKLKNNNTLLNFQQRSNTVIAILARLEVASFRARNPHAEKFSPRIEELCYIQFRALF